MKILMIIILAVSPVALSAQDAPGSLPEKRMMNRITNKAFGGPALKFTDYSGQTAIMSGGRGACIIGNRFTLGGAGYGIASRVRVPEYGSDTSRYIKAGYGGIETGYIFHSRKNCYTGGSILFARGALFLQSKPANEQQTLSGKELSFFTVLEPSLYSVARLTRSTSLSLGASYRYTIGCEGVSKSDMNGFSLQIGLLFGKDAMN